MHACLSLELLCVHVHFQTISGALLGTIIIIFQCEDQFFLTTKEYTFSSAATEQYRLFSNKITWKMNSLFVFEGEGDISGNFSKYKWTVIRYL